MSFLTSVWFSVDHKQGLSEFLWLVIKLDQSLARFEECEKSEI